MSNETVKHTQGEWQAKTDNGHYSGRFKYVGLKDSNIVIAMVYGDGSDIVAANTKLISAAPDLLDALETVKPILGGLLTYVMEHCPLDLGQHDMTVMAYNKAESAILKAI